MIKLNKLILCALLGTSCMQPALAWPPSWSALAAAIISIARAPITLVRSLLDFAPVPATVNTPAVFGAQAVAYIDKNEPSNKLQIKLIRQRDNFFLAYQFDPLIRQLHILTRQPMNSLTSWNIEQLVPSRTRYLLFSDKRPLSLNQDMLTIYYNILCDPASVTPRIKE